MKIVAIRAKRIKSWISTANVNNVALADMSTNMLVKNVLLGITRTALHIKTVQTVLLGTTRTAKASPAARCVHRPKNAGVLGGSLDWTRIAAKIVRLVFSAKAQ